MTLNQSFFFLKKKNQEKAFHLGTVKPHPDDVARWVINGVGLGGRHAPPLPLRVPQRRPLRGRRRGRDHRRALLLLLLRQRTGSAALGQVLLPPGRLGGVGGGGRGHVGKGVEVLVEDAGGAHVADDVGGRAEVGLG